MIGREDSGTAVGLSVATRLETWRAGKAWCDVSDCRGQETLSPKKVSGNCTGSAKSPGQDRRKLPEVLTGGVPHLLSCSEHPECGTAT